MVIMVYKELSYVTILFIFPLTLQYKQSLNITNVYIKSLKVIKIKGLVQSHIANK